MTKFIDEVKHTYVAIYLYSYNYTHNKQLDDCYPRKIQHFLASKGKRKKDTISTEERQRVSNIFCAEFKHNGQHLRQIFLFYQRDL